MKILVAFITAILLFPFLCSGQTDRGTIRGTVQDTSGASVPGVTVKATNVDTGAQSVAVSGDSGTYNITSLRPGVYSVTAEKSGFKKLIRENVRVEVAGTVGLELEMAVGAVNESVTVSDVAPQLKSESSSVSTGVNPKSFVELPLSANGANRSAESFIFLAPGTTGNTFDAHINGSQTLSKEIQIDGLSATTAEVGGDPRVLTMPPEAVQEFALVTSNFSAEFGNTGGGVEQFTIRSGTNQFHGVGYEFLRNDKLDARGFFNATRSINRQNEYGGSLGGPIIVPQVYNGKNKSFFFFNINYFKYRSGPVNQIASVPTDAFRNGDLSQLRDANGLIQLYDPASTRPDGQGGFTRDPFVNNQIPVNRISPVSQKVLSYVPAPVLAGILNNYPATGNNRTDNRNYTMKFDHMFSSAHRMSGSWNNGHNTDSGPFPALPRPVANNRFGILGPGQDTVRVSEDWVISPTLLNHFSVGLTRQNQLLAAPEQGQNWGEKLGLRGVNNGPFPVIFTDPFTPWGQNQDLLRTISATYLFSNSLTWVKGKHNIKVGVDFRKLQNNLLQGASSGSFTFSRNETAFPSAALRGTTGNAFASFLLGEVDNGSLPINDVTRGMRLTYFAGYIQDDYKLSPKLTLNLGLRWDLFTPMREVNNVYSIMDPTVPNPAANGYPGALVYAGTGPGRSGRQDLTDGTAYKNFGPRLGLAWSASKRLVIRTAYGISYYPTGAQGGGNAKPPATGFTANPSFFSQDQGLTSGFNWTGGFPQNYSRPPFIDPGFGVIPGTAPGTNMWISSAKLPSYTQAFNFGTQWQLRANWMLDVGWVGQKSTRLSTGAYNINQVDPAYLRYGDLLTRRIDDPAVIAAGFTRPYASFEGSLAQALRPFPQYGGVGYINSANVGNSTYHSLQAKIEKQYSNGLFLLSSYTWAKSLTDASSALSGFFSTSARDQYNRSLEKAVAQYDIPHRAVMALNYELPIGPGKKVLNSKGALGKVVGGWQVNGILSYQSGEPIGVGINNTLPLFNSRNLPDVVPGVNPNMPRDNFDPAKDVLLNINAFRAPGPFAFGNAGSILPNSRTFRNLNEDFGLMKRTAFVERVILEFRFELFNAFNRVRFGAPATNFSDAFNFGKVTSQANGPRIGQFGAKLTF
ncbi:MAG TPA: TonB-dependent receptor [Bryobacteraceae bacterium]|nr:TonB-dependent receptor [Bryobacteraceae bacterium]